MQGLVDSCDNTPAQATSPNPAVDEFLPTRNSLLSRLKDWDDEQIWRSFFDAYWRFLWNIAVRSGLAEEDVREVVQETVVAVAKAPREGRFRPAEGGSFKAWLRLIVRRRVSDHLRRAQARPQTQPAHNDRNSRTSTAERIPDPAGGVVDEIWEEEWARNLAAAAMHKFKERVGAKQYRMFDLYVLEACPVGDVARTLHVNAAQVYLAKHRVTALLRRETAKLREKMETQKGLLSMTRVADSMGLATPDRGVSLGQGGLLCPELSTVTRTDADGRFSFSPQAGDLKVVAVDTAGYGEVSAAELNLVGRILLQPWGWIQGTLKVGNPPRSEAKVWLQPLRASP